MKIIFYVSNSIIINAEQTKKAALRTALVFQFQKLIICPILEPQPGKHLRMFHTLCTFQGR